MLLLARRLCVCLLAGQQEHRLNQFSVRLRRALSEFSQQKSQLPDEVAEVVANQGEHCIDDGAA